MNKYKDNGLENMIILKSLTGEKITNIRTGTKTTVSGTPMDYIKMSLSQKNSLIAIHNHPENYSFSVSDLKMYNRMQSIETMIVLTDDYTFYLTAKNRNKINENDLEELYYKVEQRNKQKYKTFNSVEIRDLTVAEVSERLDWIYEKEKNK